MLRTTDQRQNYAGSIAGLGRCRKIAASTLEVTTKSAYVVIAPATALSLPALRTTRVDPVAILRQD
jgi:ribonuclease HI